MEPAADVPDIVVLVHDVCSGPGICLGTAKLAIVFRTSHAVGCHKLWIFLFGSDGHPNKGDASADNYEFLFVDGGGLNLTGPIALVVSGFARSKIRKFIEPQCL